MLLKTARGSTRPVSGRIQGDGALPTSKSPWSRPSRLIPRILKNWPRPSTLEPVRLAASRQSRDLRAINEQDKKAILPADSVEQYIEDGQPAAARSACRRYCRRQIRASVARLRLSVRCLSPENHRTGRSGTGGGARQANGRRPLADAQLQVQFYQNQATIVKAILAEMVRQRDAVNAHLDKLQEKLAEAKAAVTN